VLAVFWFGIALATAGFARAAPGLVSSLRGQGVLAPILRAASLASRVVAFVAGALAVLYALPQGARGLVPWLLVGLSLSAGLASWTLFRDVLALLVLGLEKRLVPGRQVRLGDVAGEIVSLSPRAVTLVTQDGTEFTVPNWRFMSQTVYMDDDPRAKVAFRLRVPAEAPRERVHRVLEELVLLSPYAVVRGRPGVRPDPDDPSAWWIEARLLDAKWARAFERTLVELAAERLQS
jgi:small-conductance mechanosensitive channel